LGTAALTIPLLLFAHLGLSAAIGVWLLFYIVAAIQSAWGIRPILKSSAPASESEGPVLKEQLRFGMRAAGASAAGFLNLRIDIFVVSIMFAPAALGWYTLAIASGELLWQVSRAFVWSAIGRIGSDSFADSATLVARLTRNTLAIVGCLGVVAFIAGPWLIIHVYGENFAPAGNALRWALPGLVAYAAEVALTNFIILQIGRPLAMVWVQSAAAIVCAGLTFATAGHYGIVAAAASTSLTKLAVTVVLITMFVRGTGISPQRLLLVQREDFRHYASVFEGMLRSLRLRSA
jgi:O-antigen/teichoic acid export membrane protein